jgi:fumarate reductase subunit C
MMTAFLLHNQIIIIINIITLSLSVEYIGVYYFDYY